MKTLIKMAPYLIIWAICAGWSMYGVTVRQYKVYMEYNGMPGKVLSAVQSGRSATVMCVVQLDNGLIESINNGYYNQRPGDTWKNSINYSRWLGMTGFAYFIVPSANRCFFETLGAVCLVYFPLVILGIYLFKKAITFWNDYVEKRVK